jgi:esterase/lipase superfamily enzyme
MQGRMTAILRNTALLAAALLLSACTLSDSLRVNEIRSVWGPGRRLPPRLVFFATDREVDGAGFGLHWGGGVAHCGRASVAISNAVTMPAPDPVLEPQPCEGAPAMAAFARSVAAAAKAQGCNSVLVILHGYNLSFRTALLHGAQMAMDAQWPCATLLLNWSSEALFDRYAADIERSGYAVPLAINLLRALNEAGLQTNILGHSMGARIALSALGALCTEPAPLVNELILAAADVSDEKGNDDFGKFLKRVTPCARRTTIYASDNDIALLASESVHGGLDRAGQTPLADLQYRALPGHIDVVDATLAIGDPSGHAYFVFSYEMLADLMFTLHGDSLQARAAQGTLSCDGDGCAEGKGRYSLNVAKARQPDLEQKVLRALAPVILPLQ